MRVLHITRDLPPAAKGGISTAVAGLVSALERVECRCGVVSFDGWRPSCRAGESTEPSVEQKGQSSVLRVSGPSDLAAARRFCLGFSPDLIHVHHGMLWDFAAGLKGALQVPLVFTVHVHQAALNALRGVEERTASLNGQERALEEADLVCTTSVACSNAVEATYASLETRTTRLGVEDTESARAAVMTRSPGELETLTYVGRFADVKGTREFLEVARLLLARRSRLRVRVVGGVPDNAKADRRWRRRWREDTPVDLVDRLEFVGWVTPARLSDLLAATSVLLVPSWTETFGLTVLEGMLHGVPIVASRCPAIAELLTHQHTGLLVPPRDVEAAASSVERLLNDPIRAMKLASDASKVAREQHLWGACIVETMDAYRYVLRGI